MILREPVVTRYLSFAALRRVAVDCAAVDRWPTNIGTAQFGAYLVSSTQMTPQHISGLRAVLLLVGSRWRYSLRRL